MSKTKILLGQRLVPDSLRGRVREALRPWFSKLVASAPNISAKHRPLHPHQRVYTTPPPSPDPPMWRDGMPAPPPHVWQGYAGPLDRFMRTGRTNMRKMRVILKEAGRDIERGQNILDFGCAGGPMTRRLMPYADDGEIWGVDITAQSVWWCRHHLGPKIKFATISTQPSLPFEDRKFDLAYCGSVFSHIPELADAWLCELARVLKPGGTLYVTYVPIEAMHRYLNEWPDIGFSQELRESFSRQTLEKADFDTLVCGRAPWAHVVYRKETFRAMCEQVFEIVSETPNVYTYQWALVLSRR